MTIPSPFVQEGPYVLAFRQGGGCLSIFGIPFFAAGVYMLAIGIGLIHQGGAPIAFEGQIILGLMGLVFTAVGGGLVFGRRWTRIDKIRRQITDQYGLLVPIKTKTQSLGDFPAVALGFDRGDSDSVDRYPIYLVSKEGVARFSIASPTAYKDAREQAVFMSEFLHLPLEDGSTGEVVVTKAGAANKPSLPKGETQEAASALRPLKMSSVVQETPSGLVISVPQPPASLFHVIFAFIPAVIGLIVFRGAFSKELLDYHKAENAFTMFFIGFFILFFVIVPITTALRHYSRTKNGKWIATMTRKSLEIDSVSGTGAAKHSIPVSDILSLEARQMELTREKAMAIQNPRLRTTLVRLAQRQNALVIKTKTDILTFSLGLPKEELDYLADLMRRKIGSF